MHPVLKESHAVLMLARDNVDLVKKAVESVFAQTIPTSLVLVDNSQTDDVVNWALDHGGIAVYPFRPQIGVSEGWNLGLRGLFKDGWEHVLVPNSDVILPPWFYSELLGYDEPFVTGIAVDSMEAIQKRAPRMPLSPTPDFSAFCIRKSAWEMIGEFNARMFLYSSDQDYHVRGHRLGVGMWKANVPYFHQRSSTLNNASPQEQAVIRAQADADRATFKAIYGVAAGGPEYEKLFLPVEA